MFERRVCCCIRRTRIDFSPPKLKAWTSTSGVFLSSSKESFDGCPTSSYLLQTQLVQRSPKLKQQFTRTAIDNHIEWLNCQKECTNIRCNLVQKVQPTVSLTFLLYHGWPNRTDNFCWALRGSTFWTSNSIMIFGTKLLVKQRALNF